MSLNRSLTCVSDIDGCQNCVVSNNWSPGIRCTSCCAREKESCKGNSTEGIVGIVSLVLVILTCTCCSGVVVYVEQRRRTRGMDFAEAYGMSSPLAEARIDEPPNADVVLLPEEDPPGSPKDLPVVAVDVPVARPRVPPPQAISCPLELGRPVSGRALLDDDDDASIDAPTNSVGLALT